MFWILWLPLFVFLCIFVTATIKSIIKKKPNYSLSGFLWGLLWGLFIVSVGLIINQQLSISNVAKVYADLENPVYIETIPGNTDGNKYLIYTENVADGGTYNYYYLNSESSIPKYAEIKSAEVRLVYDNPAKPFFVEIKAICSSKKIWLLWCTNPSPYKVEFHLSEDAIIKY